ncbi:MAG: hypothetical protein LBB38_00125 [Puniceicoccales bacterium]|jgi:hypothetical protein|nr:hypothetical protein [Puniceicoccales bacterium]
MDGVVVEKFVSGRTAILHASGAAFLVHKVVFIQYLPVTGEGFAEALMQISAKSVEYDYQSDGETD